MIEHKEIADLFSEFIIPRYKDRGVTRLSYLFMGLKMCMEMPLCVRVSPVIASLVIDCEIEWVFISGRDCENKWI